MNYDFTINTVLLSSNFDSYSISEGDHTDVVYHYIGLNHYSFKNFDFDFPFSRFCSGQTLTNSEIKKIFNSLDSSLIEEDFPAWDICIWSDFEENKCIRINDNIYREKSDNYLILDEWLNTFNILL